MRLFPGQPAVGAALDGGIRCEGETNANEHHLFAHAAETEAFLADETDYFSMAYQAVLAVDDIGIACAE